MSKIGPSNISLPCHNFLRLLHVYSTKIAVEAQHGLIAQVLKDVIFSMRPGCSSTRVGADVARVEEVVDTSMSIG